MGQREPVGEGSQGCMTWEGPCEREGWSWLEEGDGMRKANNWQGVMDVYCCRIAVWPKSVMYAIVDGALGLFPGWNRGVSF